MAHRLYSTAPGTNASYAPFLYEPAIKQENDGGVTLLDFALAPRAGFVKLRRGNRIIYETTKYGNWFTGYITNDPELLPIGNSNGGFVYGYRYEATGDEFVLNQQNLGITPVFLNRTMGFILKALAERLAPGVFTTTGVQDGTLLARYAPDPNKKFGDVAQDFCDMSNFRFRAHDHTLVFESKDAGDQVEIDASGKHFTPANLQVKPSVDPVVNDAVVLGDVEPQNRITEYFLGDGFTGDFPLMSSIYGVESSLLIDETFGDTDIDDSVWLEQDTVNDWIHTFSGFLNVVGGDANSTLVYLASQNLIPMQGDVRITHGEWDFVNSGAASTVAGFIGGLWTSAPAFDMTGLLYGLRVFRPSGGGTVLSPVVNGTVDTSKTLTVDFAKRYIIRSLVHFEQVFRSTQIYSYVDADGTVHNVGGDVVVDQATITTFITPVDPSDGSVGTTVRWQSSFAVDEDQAFAFYAPVASNDLHCSVTNITVSVPIQVQLSIKLHGDSAYQDKIVGPNEIDGYDGLSPAATISVANSGVTQSSSALGTPKYNTGDPSLKFFKDTANQTSTMPQKGDIVRLRYRRAGVAVGRVRDAASVTTEATLWGDDGVRAVARKDLDPKPRSSEECELAAAALVGDFARKHFQGTYTQFGDYELTAEPLPGKMITFSNLDDDSFDTTEFTEVVQSVRTTLVGGSPERFSHEITFGKPDVIKEFVATAIKKQDSVFAPVDSTSSLDFIDNTDVGTVFIEDVVAPDLVDWSSSELNLNAGQDPPSGGGFEIRYTDEGWGTSDGKNLIMKTTSRTFSIPRTLRGKICFIKAYDAGGKMSRFSSGMKVSFPLKPPVPVTTVDFLHVKPVITVKLDGVLTDIWGVEIRAADDVQVLYKVDLTEVATSDISFTDAANFSLILDYKAYTYNLLGEYSDTKFIDIINPYIQVDSSNGQNMLANPGFETNTLALGLDLVRSRSQVLIDDWYMA